MTYNWEVKQFSAQQLEQALEQASNQNWEIFTILPQGGHFVVVARKPH